MMKNLILVFLGGGLGSIIRYTLGSWINTLHTHQIPWGTLAVNVLACLVLGCVIGLADHRQIISPGNRLFWAVGFCGGFSTFSTFSNETLVMVQSGFNLSVLLYITLSLLLCVGATFGGLYAGEHL